MANPRLSFCIPTYNFGQYIGPTLHNILRQATHEVEVVIVDGASTDSTQAVVDTFRSSYRNLTYYRRERNMGVDEDLAKAVEFAKGEYCWLMSSDDLLKRRAVSRVLAEIQLGHAVYLCNRTECDRELNPIRDRFWLGSDYQDRVLDLSNRSELLDYLTHAQSLGTLFSYISCIIVNRQQWNRISWDVTLSGTHYAHVFRLLKILVSGGLLKYIQEPLVLCRGQNDSFADQGLLRRVMIDLNGYARVRSEFFGSGELKEALNAVMRREHQWYMLARIDKSVDRMAWDGLEQCLLDFEYGRFRVLLLRFVSGLSLVVDLARKLRTLVLGARMFVYRHSVKSSS